MTQQDPQALQYQPQSGPIELQNLAQTISLLAPGVQPITLLSQNIGLGQGTYVEYNIQRARRRLLTKTEVINIRIEEALVTNRTLIWEMWAYYVNLAGAPEPKISDQIYDVFGNVYIITSLLNVNLNLQLFSCMCQLTPP